MDNYWSRDERYERQRDEERDERRRYEADVYYDAWRHGKDPESAVRYAEQREHFDRGLSADQSAEAYVRHVQRERQEERELQAIYDEEIPF